MIEAGNALGDEMEFPLLFEGKQKEFDVMFEESFLADGLLAGTSATPGMFPLYPVPLSSLPCFADEMEEQVKAMELELLAQATQATADALKTQQQNIPALKVSRMEETPQRMMVPIDDIYPNDGTLRSEYVSHPENQRGGVPTQQQKQQQQQQQQHHHHQTLAATLQPPSTACGGGAGSSGSAPLAAALHNADCIRSGFSSPWTGGWLGCRSGPWCNRERGHIGQCNTRATIPGLSAYLPEELAAVGLPAVVELTAPLPPAAAVVALAAATAAATVASGGAAAADVMLGLGKRKSEFAAALSSGGQDSLTASDNNSYNGDEAEQQLLAGQGKACMRISKRKKADADGGHLTAAATAPGDVLDVGANTDNEAVSEELRSSMTGEAKLRSVATPLSPTKPVKKGKQGRKGKKYNKKGKNAANGVYFVDSSTPIMISCDNQMSSMPMVIAPSVPTAATAAAGAAGPSAKGAIPRAPNGRRAPQVWISGECTDPRTGMLVSVVPPASFCTQCSATSTPVWRAGPFGHKTLCNACGVRWMKVAPRSRK